MQAVLYLKNFPTFVTGPMHLQCIPPGLRGGWLFKPSSPLVPEVTTQARSDRPPACCNDNTRVNCPQCSRLSDDKVYVETFPHPSPTYFLAIIWSSRLARDPPMCYRMATSTLLTRFTGTLTQCNKASEKLSHTDCSPITPSAWQPFRVTRLERAFPHQTLSRELMCYIVHSLLTL